jgi:DNA-binding FadR family transcriptional regulator
VGRELHVAIARISGNPIFVYLCEALFQWLAQFHVDLVGRPGLEALTLAEHREILAAIENGYPDAAAKAMSDHLYRSNRLSIKITFAADERPRARSLRQKVRGARPRETGILTR